MADNKPFQVGLTGGLGCGKSTVAHIFSVLGVPVYESDFWARALYFQPDVKKEIVSLLGTDAYLSESQINTSWISETIFSKAELREKLNAILHPAVGRHYEKWLSEQKHPYILKVAALVFEAGIHKNMDLNLMVSSPEDLKKARLLKRDPHRDEVQIKKIMAAQWSDEARRQMADGEIVNDEKHSLLKQIWEWNKKIMNRL
jgi:dephospho-CoA kinase